MSIVFVYYLFEILSHEGRDDTIFNLNLFNFLLVVSIKLARLHGWCLIREHIWAKGWLDRVEHHMKIINWSGKLKCRLSHNEFGSNARISPKLECLWGDDSLEIVRAGLLLFIHLFRHGFSAIFGPPPWTYDLLFLKQILPWLKQVRFNFRDWYICLDENWLFTKKLF